jgi:protein-disulfide isomerase
MIRRVVSVCAGAGVVVGMVGTVADEYATLSATPPWLYGIFGSLGVLTTHRTFKGVPIEFLAAVWFAGVYLFCRVGSRVAESSWALLTGGTAIGALALATVRALDLRGGCWTMDAIAVLSGLVLCACAARQVPRVTELRRDLSTLTVVAIRPWPRALVSAFVCVALVGAQGLRWAEQRAPHDDNERVFLRWYASQLSPRNSSLRNGNLSITIYTDYLCPSCAAGVPKAESVIASIRSRTAVPLEVSVRDFPLDALCNAANRRPQHPAACYAAAAVRLVRRDRGNTAADDFVTWLYQSASTLSEGRISARLEELQLGHEMAKDRVALTEEVRRDVASGREVGVTGTPTVFVDGVKLVGGAGHFEAALRYALGLHEAAARAGQH